MLEEGQSISKIAKEVNITRQQIYRIKNDNELFDLINFVSMQVEAHDSFKTDDYNLL